MPEAAAVVLASAAAQKRAINNIATLAVLQDAKGSRLFFGILLGTIEHTYDTVLSYKIMYKIMECKCG